MKISFKKIILGGFFLSNLYTWGISIPIEKYTCPIGNEKFEDRYPVQCPTNKFVIFKNDFMKLSWRSMKRLSTANHIVKSRKMRADTII